MTSTEAPKITVPEFPSALEESTRRSARTLKSTVRDALDVMREVLPLILSFRGGEERIASLIETADTEECNALRQARETAETLNEQAEKDFQAAIAEYVKTRDDALAANAATVAQYEEPARQSVIAELGDVPSAAENAEAVSDWTVSVKQLRDAQANAKRQLNLEFALDIPSLPGVRKPGTAGASDDPRAWRPRFSAVMLDGEDMGDDVTSGDVFGALGITRNAFMAQFNKALGGDDIAQSRWNAQAPGFQLQVDFDVNQVGHPALFTKAEPITRAPKDAADQSATVTEEAPASE